MHQTHHDAEDISDDELLLRRITPAAHTAIQPDGTRILTSFAFRERTHEFSMYVAKEVTHEKVLSCGFPTQKIVEVRASEVRSLGYIIVREPDDCDDSHVFAKARAYKSKGQIHKDCKELAELVNARNLMMPPPDAR
jgi:hypothetical protein